MENCVFLSTQTDTPYVETYLSIPGQTIRYIKNNNGKYDGGIQITLMYLHDTAVVAYDKYLLRTPEISDTSNIAFNLLDLRRVSLPEGEYTVELNALDVNRPEVSSRIAKDIKLNFDRGKISLSSVELVENYKATSKKNVYSKNGYDIKPYPVNYYPSNLNKIIFYNEIYNADKIVGENEIIITYSIKYAQKDQVASDLFHFSRQKASSVNFVFSEFDITNLPSGNYRINIQVKNKRNEILGEQSTFFQRSNNNSVVELNNISLLNIENTFVVAIPSDSVTYYLRCINPIAEDYEKDYLNRVLISNDDLLRRQVFYNFWLKRSNEDPLKVWHGYKKQVDIANTYYNSQINYSWETDRGRVFLQYGSPNSIQKDDHDPAAFPYEIWQYYKLPVTNQTNIRFVFYNPDLVTNDYKLIHSEAYGELNDPRWRYKVFDRVKEKYNYTNLDNTRYPNSMGSHVDYNYDINH